MPPTRAESASLFGPHRLAAHALGQACGARGIEHRRAADRRLRRRRVAVAPASQSVAPSGICVSAGCDVERRGDFRRRLDHQQAQIAGQAACDLRQQVGVADQNFGAAVGQDIGDFLGLQMPVDRHHRAAQRRRGAGDLEQREIIAQHHGDRRAALQAERPQSRRRPGDAGVNLGIADAAFAADDHGRFLILPSSHAPLRVAGRGRGLRQPIRCESSTHSLTANLRKHPHPRPLPPLRGGRGEERVRSVNSSGLLIVQYFTKTDPALAVEAAQPQLLERQIVVRAGG